MRDYNKSLYTDLPFHPWSFFVKRVAWIYDKFRNQVLSLKLFKGEMYDELSKIFSRNALRKSYHKNIQPILITTLLQISF